MRLASVLRHCLHLAAVIASATALHVAPMFARTASAQSDSTGRIVGHILDGATGQGLPNVGVQVVGTTLGTLSGVDGRFVLPSVRAGTVTLHVRRLGYAPKTVTGLLLEPRQTIEQSVTLETATVQLQMQVVTASSERGSVATALDQQRTANGIVNAVTSEQISRSPDSDAAQAVQRVSGVTVTDGKYVFVRGLGERYTTASLNGARIPSPEPERRVVPLDLFPSGLLQTVTTVKTFTPDLSGDFGGAHVDIQTREFPLRRQTVMTSGVSWNTTAAGQQILSAPTVGGEWAGFAGSQRNLPQTLLAAGNFQQSFSQGEVNSMVGSLRNSWSARRDRGTPGSSFSASSGGETAIAGQRLGYVLSGTYSYAQEVREAEVRSEALRTGNGLSPINTFTGETGRTSVLWGGLANATLFAGRSTRIAFNNTYTRTSDNEAHTDSGFFENLDRTIRRTTLRFVERTVRSHQLRTDHIIGDRHAIDWSLTGSGVTRREPDRSDLVYLLEPAIGQYIWADDPNSARRTFSDLDETNYAASANYRLAFGSSRQAAVKMGGLARVTQRNSDNRQYSLYGRLSLQDRARPAEEIFDGRYTGAADSVFGIQPLGAGGSYKARDNLLAGYGMLELPLMKRLQFIGGARVERADLDVTSYPLVGQPVLSGPLTTDVLPSLALNYRFSDQQTLRASVSQTLARPEYREVSNIVERDVLGGQSVIGNPTLKRTLVRSADLRWEWYPDAAEVLSLGVFAKQFIDPIERVEVASSGQSMATFVNANQAFNVGVEIEVRQGLDLLSPILSPLTAFVNATVMRSDISTANSSISASGNDNRPMVGQAPYVINTGLGYTSSGGGTSATLLYNVVGKRISSAGSQGYPDVYERPRHVVDFSLRVPLFHSLSAKLDLKNALDAPYEWRQDEVVRQYYRAGRVVGVAVTWRP